MKISIIIVFIAFMAKSAAAQVYFDDGSGYETGFWSKKDENARKRIVQNHIREVKSMIFRPDTLSNNLKTRSEAWYDNNGNLVHLKSFNKRGKSIYEYLYVYDGQNHLISTTRIGREGKIQYHSAYNYNDAGDNTDMWMYRRGYSWHREKRYNANHQVSELAYYDNNNKLTGKYVYSYYDDGSKKQTVEYNSKGKVDHTWNYDCSPVGKLANKTLKDTSKVCMKYELDPNGNKIRVQEEFLNMGIIKRVVRKYDMNDNLTAELRFDKKGNLRYQMTALYNDQNQGVSYRYQENIGGLFPKDIRYQNQYDESGNLVQQTEFKKGDKPEYMVRYSYISGLSGK